MIWALLLTPTLAGLAAFALRWNWPRRGLLLAAAAAHTALVATAWVKPPAPVVYGWMAVDAASLLFLTITSVLFLAAAIYAVGYLAAESHGGRHRRLDDEEYPFVNYPEAVFAGCLLLFLATMTLVTVSRHLGLMWVAVEATTLASAPLIYFHRHRYSLEATWKYLVICSVGIALALLGVFFVAVAARSPGGPMIHLTIDGLLAHVDQLDHRWLQAAFLLFLVGYGTKMGLAPLHTWLPDAHSEAPSVVSALLSGALLNCAFLTVLRGHSLLAAAGHAQFSGDLLVLFGMVSMTVAAVFIIGQSDFKRMLAYSSVEHMGILAVGVGIGGIAGFGALLRVLYVALGGSQQDWAPMIWIVAILTMAVGSVLALTQSDVKRMLAYSSVAHAGFLLTGVASTAVDEDGVVLGVSSVLFYLVTYGFTTIGAFAVVTLVRDATGEATHLSSWAGLGRRSPLVAGIFGLFLLAFAGIPLTSGFTGKFAVFAAAFAGGAWPLVVVGVLASALAAFFYVRVIVLMFFSEPPEDGPTIAVPSVLTTLAVALGVAVTVVLGVMPSPILDLAEQASRFVR